MIERPVDAPSGPSPRAGSRPAPRPALLLAVVVLAPLTGLHAQAPAAEAVASDDTLPALTAEDYAAAERRLSSFTSPLVHHASVSPRWMEDGRFWYANDIREGTEFVLVDPEERSRSPAFDHQRLAAAISVAAGGAVARPFDLPFGSFELDEDSISFVADDQRFTCDLDRYRCRTRPMGLRRVGSGDVVSPDGSKAVFIRDHDLWLREIESGRETRLTTDGVEDFGYATNNAGWIRSDRPVVKWSPDSRRLATFRHDARGVGMMYLTRTEVGHPTLEAWRYPLPEDSVIFRISRLVIDTEAAEGERLVPLDLPPDPHRSTVCDHVYCGGEFADNEWSADGSELVFVTSSRDHKRAQVRKADTRTGAVTDLFEEVEETFYESGGNWRFLSSRDEVLWFSQRDDWGHLYLYDADSGALKRQVTGGEGNVREILRVDEGAGVVYAMGNERESGDPYFEYFYAIDLDSGDVELLTPDSAHHDVSLSPDGEHFVDRYSTPTTPPVAVLRTMEGDEVMELERADVSSLLDTGWRPPVPFSVKARDGITDLHGLLFRPYGLDPDGSYPVVNYVYPGPQSGSVGSRSFSASRRDHDAMAQLGFAVVALDAMGTPGRSKSFHEAYYGDMGDNGLPDQVGAIRQLAERHPWMDLDRVGIWGHSGGGFASTGGILRYPDFYKVAVSQAGNHDNRNYEDDWGEKWQGLLEVYPDGSTSYDNQANQLLAAQLEGKLLLAHGTMDSNVPPSNTMLVVDALIEANKDFDLILFPNRRHGFANEPYMMRRRWDYFVRHLMGAEPPPAFDFGRQERPAG